MEVKVRSGDPDAPLLAKALLCRAGRREQAAGLRGTRDAFGTRTSGKHLKLDTSKLAAIAHSMELKQKSIQNKLDAPPQRPPQKRRLRAKYSRRRYNRSNQVLHVVSREISKILAREKVKPVFEDLTGIRESMRSNPKTLRKICAGG